MTITVDQRPGWSWSYSKLKNFETCPKRHYHYEVAKDVREPESPQLVFGNQMHDALAKRMKDGVPLPVAFARAEGVAARLFAAPGKRYVEQKWAITSSFQNTKWFGDGAWFRTIVDYGKHNVDTQTMTIIDWKSGRPAEDLTQLQLMAAATFIHFPTVQRVKAALVFTEHDHVEPAQFTRGSQQEIWTEILPRVKALRTASEKQEYPAKPGKLCRRYCAVISCPHHGK